MRTYQEAALAVFRNYLVQEFTPSIEMPPWQAREEEIEFQVQVENELDFDRECAKTDLVSAAKSILRKSYQFGCKEDFACHGCRECRLKYRLREFAGLLFGLL